MTYTRSADFVTSGDSRRSEKMNRELDLIAAAFSELAGSGPEFLALLTLKANIASPTFTGVPAAPTAAIGTVSTQLATTEFVLQNAASSGYSYPPTATHSGQFLTNDGVTVSWGDPIVSVTWASITDKPTTLDGFGITNAQHALEIAEGNYLRMIAPRRIRFNGLSVKATQDAVTIEAPAFPHFLLLAQGII